MGITKLWRRGVWVTDGGRGKPSEWPTRHSHTHPRHVPAVQIARHDDMPNWMLHDLMLGLLAVSLHLRMRVIP